MTFEDKPSQAPAQADRFDDPGPARFARTGAPEDASLSRGFELMGAARYDEARACFAKAIEASGASVEAYAGLGGALLHLGRFSESQAAFERALERQPGLPPVRDALGVCLMKQGQLQAAVTHQLAAVDADPGLETAYVNLFNTLMLMHVTDDARRVAEAGVAALPTTSGAALELQIGLAKLGWLEGRPLLLKAALDASLSIHTDHDEYPNVGRLRFFHRYLRRLHAFRQAYSGAAYTGTPDHALFFVSDAHGLAASETVAYLGDRAHRVLSVLVDDGRAAELARSTDNEFRASVRAVLRAIPPGHPVMFGFGAVDCRSDDRADRAKAVGADVVDAYVDFAATVARANGHEPMFYGVAAPTRAELEGRGEPASTCLIERVRTFNDGLRASCGARGVRLLDVFTHTATVEGTASAGHHIDEQHVHPGLLRALLDRPPNGPPLRMRNR